MDLILFPASIVVEDDSIPKRNINIKAKIFADNTRESHEIIDELDLICLDTCKNGLFVYEYEYKESKKNYLLDRSNFNITHVVYHAIKSFYHQHEYHDQLADSIVDVCCSPNKIEIREPNNPALLHYLALFEEMFVNAVEEMNIYKSDIDCKYINAEKRKEKYLALKRNWEERHCSLKRIYFFRLIYFGYPSYLYRKNECKNKNLRKIEIKSRLLNVISSSNGRIKQCLDDYENFSLKCRKIRCKYLYYQSLSSSKYNTIFKLGPDGNKTQFVASFRTKKRKSSKFTQVGVIKLFPNYDLLTSNERNAYRSAINLYNAINTLKHYEEVTEKMLNNKYHSFTLKQAEGLEKLSEKADNFACKAFILATLVAFIAMLSDYYYFKQSPLITHTDEYHTVDTIFHGKIHMHLADYVIKQRKSDSILQEQSKLVNELKQLILYIGEEQKKTQQVIQDVIHSKTRE